MNVKMLWAARASALTLAALCCGGRVCATGVDSISDVRVAPMVASQWGQDTFGGTDTFNRLLPNGYPSGCTAAAFAQLMRHWAFPTAAVAPVSRTCWVDGVAGTYTMTGGTYDWSAMPLLAADCTSDGQRDALAHLYHDVAIAVQTSWTAHGSGAYNAVAAEAMQSVFGYAAVRSFNPNAGYFGITGINLKEADMADLRNAILASLDAGMPVVVSLTAESGLVHQTIIDGYGFNGGNDVYCHLVCGWEGDNDGWYNLVAEVGGVTDFHHFTGISDVVYNLHPQTAGDIISGRVLDASGAPLAGITVSLKGPSKGDAASVQTNEKGIYFFRFSAKGKYTISVDDATHGKASRTVNIAKAGKNIDGTLNDDNGYMASSLGIVANRWGEDLTLTAGGESGGGEEEQEDDGPEPEVVAGTLDPTFAAAQKPVTAALYDNAGALYGTVQIKAGKRNKKTQKVKISAAVTMMDGKKITAKAANMTIAANGRLSDTLTFKAPIGAMTFTMAKSGAFALGNAQLTARAAAIGIGLGGGTATAGTFVLDAGFDLAVPGQILGDLLPTSAAFDVVKGKWKFAKNASVKWAKDRATKEYGLVVDTSKGKTNLSAMKLTYTAKTGLFKGSFKVYALEEASGGKKKLKKYTVNVVGFVVDGVGIGRATCKKPAGGLWNVTIVASTPEPPAAIVVR